MKFYTIYVKSNPLFTVLFYLLLNYSINAQWVTHHNPIFQGSYGKPALQFPYLDPAFGTKITRITNAFGLARAGSFPQYSKRQAWNANETRMIIFSAEGKCFLYDGSSYQFIKELPGLEGEDIFWHPSNPNQIIFVPDNVIRSYNILNDQISEIYTFPQYSWVNTRGEGNLSRDGRYYAFVGQTYDTTTHFKDILVFDLQTNSVISTMPLPASLEDFDWVSISPTGNYVVVNYATMDTGRYQGVEVYSRNLNFLWQKPLGYGHSDLGIDGSGNEFLVIDYYDENTNSTFIKKINLSNGATINLLEYSWSFYTHISCRNIVRADWCFVSTFDGVGRLMHDSLTWLPFEDEIFALKLDGSGDVQRIAHHHSRRYTLTTPDPDNSIYWAEPHATVNQLGTKLLYGSNWGERVESDTSVDAYVVDLSILLDTKEEFEILPSDFLLFQNYPNPFNPSTVISYQLPVSSEVTLKVFDVLGNKIATLVNEYKSAGSFEVEFNASSLSSGVYFYQLRVADPEINSGQGFIQTKKMLMVK